MSCLLFNTHHAPAGAWASLTFGAPGVGVSIDFQEPNVKKSGALLAGVAYPQEIRTIGFAERPQAPRTELTAEGDKEKKARHAATRWKPLTFLHRKKLPVRSHLRAIHLKQVRSPGPSTPPILKFQTLLKAIFPRLPACRG